jgi:hypothetical protein
MHTTSRLQSAVLIASCLLVAAAERLEAQDVAVPAAVATPAEASPAGLRIEPVGAPLLLASTSAPQADGPVAATNASGRRSRHAITSLYAGFVATQALDVHSTLRALNAGHKEANPLMRWATSSPAAFVGFKTAATAGTLLVIERVRKKHPVRAVFLMAAVDTAYAFVVAHNYSAPVSKR